MAFDYMMDEKKDMYHRMVHLQELIEGHFGHCEMIYLVYDQAGMDTLFTYPAVYDYGTINALIHQLIGNNIPKENKFIGVPISDEERLIYYHPDMESRVDYHVLMKEPGGASSLYGLFFIEFVETYSSESFTQIFNQQPFPLLANLICNVTIYSIQAYEKLFYTIDLFAEIIARKDKFMPFHMNNVANRCNRLSAALELDRRDSMILYIAALLHDVGKIYIDDNIINKPGSLTEQEYEKIKAHSEKGFNITNTELMGMDIFKDVPSIIKHHHEKFDGTGYPDALKGEDIPYLSRVLALADTVDAMMSVRSYKDQEPTSRIIEELKRCSGTQFDPELVEVMIDVLLEDPQGSGAHRLSTFIPKASIAMLNKINESISHFGNVVINGNHGKFILHEKVTEDEISSESRRVYIGYYLYGEFFEYRAEMLDQIQQQLLIEKFIYEPLDNFAYIRSNISAYITSSEVKIMEASVVKLGVSNLYLEVTDYEHDVLKSEKSELLIAFEVDMDGVRVWLRLKGQISRVFIFEDRQVLRIEINHSNYHIRDTLAQAIFEKKIIDEL